MYFSTDPAFKPGRSLPLVQTLLCAVCVFILVLNGVSLVRNLDGLKSANARQAQSDREFQVFLRLAKGATVSDIGNALSLSIKTVSTYRTRIMEKMGLQSNSDLTYYAMKNNLLD